MRKTIHAQLYDLLWHGEQLTFEQLVARTHLHPSLLQKALDSPQGKSFVQQNGKYRLRLLAKLEASVRTG